MIIDHVCVDILQFYCNSKIIAIPQVPIIIIPQSPSRLPHGAQGQATQERFLSSLTNILSRLMRETMMIIMSYLTTWCVSSYILLMILSSRPLCRAGCSVTTWRAFLDTSTIHPGSSNSYHLTRTLRLACALKLVNQQVGIDVNSSVFRLWDWTLSWILHSVIPQMQLLARLPKRDSPSLATRQAGSKVTGQTFAISPLYFALDLNCSIQVKGVIPYPRIGKRSQQTSVGNAVIPYPRVGRSSPDYY